MSYSSSDLQEVRKRAVDIRANIIEMIPAGKVGHFGGSCSVADIAAALYCLYNGVKTLAFRRNL